MYSTEISAQEIQDENEEWVTVILKYNGLHDLKHLAITYFNAKLMYTVTEQK